MTADRPTTEPRTEAGKQLAARAKRESWSNWEGLAQFTIPAIEAEAAQGAAPRAEGLDSPREFGRIFGKVMQANPKADASLVNDILIAVRDNLRPSDERVPESEEPRKRGDMNGDIALADLLRDFPPWRAKRHPGWTWKDEAENVKTRMCLCCGRPGHYQQVLEAHIAEHGMEGMGVYLKDGSVGDGHHRIVAAMNLGIERIPLESHDDVGARWMRDHGPVSWEERTFGDV